MAQNIPTMIENAVLRVEVDSGDLAAHVTVKTTGETLRMAGSQPDDVLMVRGDTQVWKSFASSPIAIRKTGPLRIEADLPGVALSVRIELDESDVIFEVAPQIGRAHV